MGISEARSGKTFQAKHKAYEVVQDGKTRGKVEQGPKWHLERAARSGFHLNT